MENGFITIHRKLLENPIAKHPQLLSLFIHLLLMASHKETLFLWNKKEEQLRRGQLITGRYSLAEQTGLNPNTIKDYLRILKNLKIITIKSTNKFSVITIVKYSDYQDRKEKNTTKSTNQTPARHQPDTTFNNVNNGTINPPPAATREDKPFTSADYIATLINSPVRNSHIIGLYWLKRKFKHPTVEAARTAYKRDLRAASNLTGYTDEQILQTMDYFDNDEKRDFVWTLETVHKRIDNIIANLK